MSGKSGFNYALSFMIHHIVEVDITRDKAGGDEILDITFIDEIGQVGNIVLFLTEQEKIKIHWPGKALRKLKGSVVERMKFTRGDKVKE